MKSKWDSMSNTKKILIAIGSCFGVFFLMALIGVGFIWIGIIPHAGTKATAVSKPRVILPKYQTIEAVLDSAGDYRKENGTLKILSKNEVQVSSLCLDTESDYLMKLMCKRDIVYVALQVFAQTEINSFKIVAIPMMYKASEGINPNKPGKYWGLSGIRAGVNRSGGDYVLKKHFNRATYEDLYIMDGHNLRLSPRFERLLNGNIASAYDDLIHGSFIGAQ
jgi:hypothetical protein